MNDVAVTLVADPLWNTLLRFSIDVVVLFILIRIIYYRFAKKKEYSFSFFLMGIMIFFMCELLKNVEISLGIGFGLFALFSILRFRTKNLTIKTMTYFFTTIGVSAINALAQYHNMWRGPLIINSIILLSVLLLEISFPEPEKLKDKDKGGEETKE